MPRQRRYIKSNSLYEITFRSRDTLPFACTELMKVILQGILARIQRDNKVTVHHYIFEGSHPHILCTANDADQCQKFYGQLQKQITDSIKRLLGLEHLNIWDGRASVIEIGSLEDAIDKIGYLYSNPSNDDLETCIEQYPGVNSWNATLEAGSVNEAIQSEHPWIQLPMIPALPSSSVTAKQDSAVCEKMLAQAKYTHSLRVYPYQWLRCFLENPTEEDLKRVKAAALENLRRREKENSERRAENCKKVLGAARLRRQPLLKPHTPKKKGRKIFVQSMFREVRQRIIENIKQVDELCRKVYQKWKVGDFSVLWPPGTFPPPLPPMANAVLW